ncbi:MAG: cobalt ECF transporter T component CbiQ [Clostridia bacterium]|nr:cobalt ECF transporter T component CbiQ [Clostridia bacterium]
MIITAILAALVLWCLFCGSLAPIPLGLICVLGSVLLGVLGRHDHSGGILHIDALAQRSRLSYVNPSLKTWGCIALLVICVVSDSVAVGLTLCVAMAVLTVGLGRLPLRDYLSLLALPAAFLLLSSLALLFSWSPAPAGVLNLPFFGGWLSVTAAAQARTVVVLCKSLGAVSCLYLLSLSTPLTELIAVLRRAHVPAVVVELMYLIYRYIFILLEMHRTMRDAAESRLGYAGLKCSLRTTGAVYGGLLARSFRKAGACFDAMESRCYDGEIRFLESSKPITALHGLAACILVTAISALAVFGSVL